jgi:hypothetical protein
LEVKKRNPPAKETNDRMHHRIEINRVPVLTLWAAVVAERLGFDWQEEVSARFVIFCTVDCTYREQHLGVSFS